MKLMKKRFLSILLAVVMVLTMIPMPVFATETENVYLSISYDGEYIDDKNGNAIVYLPISLEDIAAIDLVEYGLENMLYDADGDGEYEITALQLLIYAHEEIYGGDWSEVTFDALPGSSYFKGGIFGFTENLVYFHNGDFPVDESQASDYMTVGATSDRIVLEAGDFLDVASFECFSFLWDPLGGFHFFADEVGNFLHDFTVEAGETLPIKLMHSFCDLMFGESYLYGAADYEVFYGKTYGEAIDTLTTDGDGNIDITIDEPGTYYLWCYGANGSDDGTHGSCDHYMNTGDACIVSAPAYAVLTVSGGATPTPTPEQPRQPQSVSSVLNATMAQLATTVTAPTFGTNAGEWTVFSLARGGHFAKDSTYFKDYYNRIVKIVDEMATEVNKSGSLDNNKSTENSRLIVALSSIGKDATGVGKWDLVEAYSANGINWIKKQGINGTIWTLIALDSNNYATSDTSIRQQLVNALLEAQHDDNGWSLVTAKAQPSNVDITCMTLTALYPYRNQPEVAAACEKAIQWLSEQQLTTGGFPYGNGETSESCAWAIVALTTWGINPDTDARFIKDGKSAIDNLLTYYVEEDRMFAHQGTEANAMATDQACYALVAYDRFLNDKNALYDMSDVEFDKKPEIIVGKPVATLGLPEKITNEIGKTFNVTISLDQWDNEAGYKMIDYILNVPEGLSVTAVTAEECLSGGEVSYNLEADTGKLRVVYFDANNHSDLTVESSVFPTPLFTVTFRVDGVSKAGYIGTDATPITLSADGYQRLNIELGGMSIKRTSDSTDEDAMLVVDSTNAAGSIVVVNGLAYSAVCLYEGDDVDLIPSDKKAVSVAVVGAGEKINKLIYVDGEYEYDFLYSGQISKATNIPTYVALVDASIEMAQFALKDNFVMAETDAEEVTFGDVNGDGIVNAQDALAAVDTWLRKTEAPSDKGILTLNVNSDSRINTFDALGIVEAFVDGKEYIIVTKAKSLNNTTK